VVPILSPNPFLATPTPEHAADAAHWPSDLFGTMRRVRPHRLHKGPRPNQVDSDFCIRKASERPMPQKHGVPTPAFKVQQRMHTEMNCKQFNFSICVLVNRGAKSFRNALSSWERGGLMRCATERLLFLQVWTCIDRGSSYLVHRSTDQGDTRICNLSSSLTHFDW
jgi:hypothetical protein